MGVCPAVGGNQCLASAVMDVGAPMSCRGSRLANCRVRGERELLDDPDRSLHAELGLFAAILGAKDACEDVDAWALSDQFLLDSASREWSGELREADPELGGFLVVGGTKQGDQPSGVVGVLDANPLDRVYEEAAVLESHELAVVKRARTAEREVDRADCRAWPRKRPRRRRLTDHERGVRGVGVAAAQIVHEVVARLQGRLGRGGSLVGADVEHDRAVRVEVVEIPVVGVDRRGALGKAENCTPGLRRISTGSVCLTLTFEMMFTAPDWSAPLTRTDRPFRVSVSVGRPELVARLTDITPTIDATTLRIAAVLVIGFIAALRGAT